MKFVVLLLFTNIGLLLSFSGKHQYPTIENVYDTGVLSENEDFGHRVFKKSISVYPSFENSVSLEGTVQEPCRLTLPTLELSATPQEPYRGDKVQEYPPEVIPPRIPNIPYNIPLYNWTPYDVDYSDQEPAYKPYNSYMPYMYLNSVPSVKSLPPVISTHIHESIPEVPQMQDDYDMNGLSDNDIYFPPYVRAVRSRDEEILEQLEKDAMIPNVLPTMPFPYMRSASPSYEAHHSQSGPVAIFPPGSSSDCALPFLVSCSPNIYQGVLTKNVYGKNPNHSH